VASGVSNIMEDYLESIYCITQRRGFARTKDVARDLNVSSPTVTEMLKKLKAEKLINYEPYAPVTLTLEGEKLAKAVFQRHETLAKLLNIILVSEKVASEDACRMEHILHPETIEQFSKLVDFVEKSPHYPKWLIHFKKYCQTGRHECENKD
jgi:DtxR family transcriptional regulator, Mn-dependent transcriptional regulator